MALADYYDRTALAAAQVIAGFREDDFARILARTTVGLALGPETNTGEGHHLADMTIRLFARLYPKLSIVASPEVESFAVELTNLARQINPEIEIVRNGPAKLGIVIGVIEAPFATAVHAGSQGWIASVSTEGALPIGKSGNPFGAGASACIAVANVFRLAFMGDESLLDNDVAFSTYLGDVCSTEENERSVDVRLPERTVLVGLGAIGNGAAWALGRCSIEGSLHLVDPESLELSNMQRYVLSQRSDEGRAKTDLIREHFSPSDKILLHDLTWSRFVETEGYDWARVLVALDSARDRKAVQASLPGLIVNAWTQPGDLGVSTHGRFGGPGSCLYCLYMPTSKTRNEDEIVAEAFKIPDKLMEVRLLLDSGGPVTDDLVALIGQRLGIEPSLFEPFHNQPLRVLHVEGLCGGALVPLDGLGVPDESVHVPLAHQSALAGILLAAAFVRQNSETPTEESYITRIDFLKPMGDSHRSPVRKGDTRCICSDADYTQRHASKWGDG